MDTFKLLLMIWKRQLVANIIEILPISFLMASLVRIGAITMSEFPNKEFGTLTIQDMIYTLEKRQK